ncbi:MAG: PSD1 and planctomycete cytochrome C domain-containing protein [Pirellulales bacterium]
MFQWLSIADRSPRRRLGTPVWAVVAGLLLWAGSSALGVDESADNSQPPDKTQQTASNAGKQSPNKNSPAKKSPAKKKAILKALLTPKPTDSPAPAGAVVGAVATERGLALFEKRIRPALVQHCYECHSQEKGEPKGGLLVDSRAGLLEGGESGAAIVPGNPEDSLLLEALRHDGLEMPPERKLPDDLIADFETWIRLGAPDPRQGEANSGARKIDIAEGRKFWAFQPVATVEPPKTFSPARADWPRSDVDRFLLSAMEADGVVPVGDADRRTLLRRLTFDLTGLPPTPDELAAFEADRTPDALEKVVDRLLKSPRFGERWGKHWLDVARYAESNGNTDNVTYPHAWRYRDYVYESLNADKPFNQFLLEQVAGDLMPADSPAQRDSRLIATGFLALGSKPRAQNNPDFEMDVVAEQIEVTTTAFMALTVACARCHDHKFDPIPIEEYYSMAGIFTSTATLYSGGGGQGNGKLRNTGFHALTTVGGATAAEPVTGESSDEYERLRAEREGLETRLRRQGAEIIQTNKPATSDSSDEGSTNQADSNDAKKAKKKAKKKAAKQQAAQAAAAKPTYEVKTPANADEATRRRIANLERQWREVVDRMDQLAGNRTTTSGDTLPGAVAMGVRDARQVADCKLCLRGDSQKRGPAVPRGVVSVIPSSESVKIPADQSGRLELARWMASPDHPLTARVFVNRVWKHLFGRGIVPTVDNFGALGEPPSHPELLDYLAARFVADGWSIKQLIRQLVLTRAYGLSSESDVERLEKDPDNVLVWRHAPRRLDGESIRDAILAVSGQLQADSPGVSVVAGLGEREIRGKRGEIDLGVDQLRHRSAYLPILRNAMPEVLELFDAADPSLVVGSRDVTTVPAQSLYLMNSPFVVRQSRYFAERLISAEPSTPDARVDLAFALALGRAATADEKHRVVDFVQKVLTTGAGADKSGAMDETAAWSCFTQALLASAEFRYVE